MHLAAPLTAAGVGFAGDELTDTTRAGAALLLLMAGVAGIAAAGQLAEQGRKAAADPEAGMRLRSRAAPAVPLQCARPHQSCDQAWLWARSCRGAALPQG